MPNYPNKHGAGSRSNGGTPRFFRSLVAGELHHWAYAPEHEWSVPITAATLTGAASTQLVEITIPASGFVSGRLTVTFTGYGLGAPVSVVADAAVGDANTDLAVTLEAAIATARGTTLAGVVADETVATNVVAVEIVQGLTGTITIGWRSAEVYEIEFLGTLIDSTYNVTISGGGLGAPVPVDTVRTGGSPAAITNMIVQRETDLEGLIATTLAGVLVSADDDGATLNTLQFEPDIADVTITTSENPTSWSIQFGGTETDGNYDSIFAHASLPGGSTTVRTPRVASVPATNAALAVQHEADIEGWSPLFGYVASADDDTVDTCIVISEPGVSGLTVTTAAPAPGTLVATELDQTVTDVTPAGPTVTVAYSVEVDLQLVPASTLSTVGGYNQGARGGFPTHVDRHGANIQVATAFGAGRTLTLGDTLDPDGLLGATPVDLNATGRTITGASEAEYRTRYESAFSPLITIALGASATVTTGRAVIGIVFSPVPFEAAA